MEESDEDLGTHEDEELNEIMEFVFGGEDISIYLPPLASVILTAYT